MSSPTKSKNNNNTSTKFRQLHDTFIKCYNNQSPHFFVRAPGRVNLIGEHIDYEGYGVLPMALSQEVVLAVGIGDSNADHCRVRVARDDKGIFPPGSFPTDPRVAMDRDKKDSSSDWARYVRSGYKGTFLMWDDDEDDDAVGSGGVPMNILVDGNIPIAKGLSSSSALVVASIIATAKARDVNSSSSKIITTDLPSSRHHLADIARRAEQFVGTMSGGMDQTISCLGQVQYVSFDPLRTEAVSLPPGVTIVVADSLTVEEKAVTADVRYNKRVVECALAAKYLAKGLGMEGEVWKGAMTLREVQEAYGEMTGRRATLKDMMDAVESHLPREGCTCETIVEMMGLSPTTGGDDGGVDLVDTIMSQLFEKIAPSKRVMIERVVSKSNDFELYRRAMHVYAEAQRVLEFKELCNNDDGTKSNDTVMELGRLMNDSHDSCRDMYDCSSLKLDQLISVCRNIGALGSRLTGAGWGGSVVSMVREERVDEFLDSLKREFYGNEKYVDPSVVVDDVVFVCQPSDGASIIVDLD